MNATRRDKKIKKLNVYRGKLKIVWQRGKKKG